MSVDTKAHVNISEGFIRTFISNTEDVSSFRTHDTGIEGFTIFLFNYKGEERQFNFHQGLGLFGSNLVTCGFWGEAINILEDLVETFSGVYQKNDSEEHYEVVNSEDAKYNEHNGVYVIKWAISKGYIHDTKLESIIEAHKRFDEEIRN